MRYDCRREFDFTFLLSIPNDRMTDDLADAIIGSGCDDATLGVHRGNVYLTFTRQSDAQLNAMVSAINDVELVPGVKVVRVDECDLVTQAEIARRSKISRQRVNQWISGKDSGFPSPASALDDSEGGSLWYWCDVVEWLVDTNRMREQIRDDVHESGFVASLLHLRDLENRDTLLKKAPKDVREFVESVLATWMTNA